MSRQNKAFFIIIFNLPGKLSSSRHKVSWTFSCSRIRTGEV